MTDQPWAGADFIRAPSARTAVAIRAGVAPSTSRRPISRVWPATDHAISAYSPAVASATVSPANKTNSEKVIELAQDLQNASTLTVDEATGDEAPRAGKAEGANLHLAPYAVAVLSAQ
jgi:hypothetical protein